MRVEARKRVRVRRGQVQMRRDRGAQHIWPLEQFPFVQAIQKWAAAKKRRPAAYGGCRWQKSEPEIAMMDQDSDGEPLT
eukprot:1136375-Pelagomonas_calceolata.AAC.5